MLRALRGIAVLCVATLIAVLVLAEAAMADHGYPVAKIVTASGKEVMLTEVTVVYDAQKIGYLSYSHGEIDHIIFRHHNNLGPEFESKNEVISLYKGEKPVYFKRITFNAKGDVVSIAFVNREDLLSKDVDIKITSEGYTGDPWIFYGRSGAQEVNIRGSRIKSVTFEGVPPQTEFDKR
jgi:hypothetical protein